MRKHFIFSRSDEFSDIASDVIVGSMGFVDEEFRGGLTAGTVADHRDRREREGDAMEGGE